MPEKDPTDDIVDAVATGKCILFLGAGVHSRPPKGSPYIYPGKERPPVGSAFSRYLAAKSGFKKEFPKEDVRNLLRVSQHFQQREKRSGLTKELIAAVFTGKEPSPIVRALANLDFKLIVTTNYDNLFETALIREKKKPFVSVYEKNEQEEKPTVDFPPLEDEASSQRPFVFKMHGDIDRSESIVITDEDYIHFVLRMTQTGRFDPIPKTIQEKFRKWPTLFIGYSLKDYNLRVLFRTMRWKIDQSKFPDTYSIDLYPDPLIKTAWGDFVSFVAADVWTFVPELYRRIRNCEMPP